MKFNNIIEKKIMISDIPTIVLRPKEDKRVFPTIIFYHGWSSNKDAQKFRASIISCLGYQVIIPDSIYHGDRKALDEYNQENATRYFWDVILNNIAESDEIIDYGLSYLNVDSERIGLIGHSMGGFTAAGVFIQNENISTSVILNGSFNWQGSNNIFKEHLDDFGNLKEETQERVDRLDPMNNIERLGNRPILMLNGGSDPVVDKRPQIEFYEKILSSYEDKSRLNYIEYPNLGHFVTTNMMEDACTWFNQYL